MLPFNISWSALSYARQKSNVKYKTLDKMLMNTFDKIMAEISQSVFPKLYLTINK